METAIGVFVSRERAEEAVRELLRQRVPQESIVFLTRSESEAIGLGKELGAYAGGFVGGSVGMAGAAVASLAIPGIGLVFALGVGATALLGLIGAGTGAAVGKAISEGSGVVQPTADAQSSEDAAFFREVLKEGRSLIVVRTDSLATANAACGILDRLGIGMKGRTPGVMQIGTRQLEGVTVLDIKGRITLGEGNVMLRELIRSSLDKANKRILLNLREVDYVDSSGLGELVKSYTTVHNQGGQLKLVNLSDRVRDLLQATHLIQIFDVQRDEPAAVASYRG
jgi:anti-sigma B factor antagonist